MGFFIYIKNFNSIMNSQRVGEQTDEAYEGGELGNHNGITGCVSALGKEGVENCIIYIAQLDRESNMRNSLHEEPIQMRGCGK